MDHIVADPAFWNDNSRARAILSEKATLEKTVKRWKDLRAALDDVAAFIELAETEHDDTLLLEAEGALAKANVDLADLEIKRLMADENSEASAIMYINSGAGGTESQDWVDILKRMYLRWAERQGFKAEIMDALPGEEAGFKNVTLGIYGEYAYGYLRAEGGVHRLVRISPFDSQARRHTSFASVAVYPDIEDKIEIDIPDKDIRIDVFRSSGAGGQSVNTTDSAVRITHLPTGIVVQCQNERSQLKNKGQAMKILKARLYEREEEARLAEREKGQDKRDIDFGSQIRSYVMQPYQLIKDHRTGYETGNINPVMDGDVTPFMESFLVYRADQSAAAKNAQDLLT